MILKDNLYKIDSLLKTVIKGDGQEDSNTIRGEGQLLLDSEHFIYKAHFPNEPVTPGVCLLQIAKELTEELLGKRLYISSVKNVKFLSVVSPVKTPMVTYKIEVKDATAEPSGTIYKVRCEVSAGEQLLAKISMTLNIKD